MKQSMTQSFYDMDVDDCAVSGMKTVTLSPKYQVVIPKDVREELDLEPGQKLMAMAWEGTVHLVPVASVDELYGSLPGLDTTIEREPDRF